MCFLKSRRRIYYRDKDWKPPRDLTIPIPSQYPSQLVFPGPSYEPLPSSQITPQACTPIPNYQQVMAASTQSLPMPQVSSAMVPFSAMAQPLAMSQSPTMVQPATMLQAQTMIQQPYGMAQAPAMFQPSAMMPPSIMAQPFSMTPMVQTPQYYGPYPSYSAFMHPRF
ncbi:hypothetical protein F5B22DRAFT_594116 [Xylaria bambusicola]|uniref:uncharacterized protein n=1 Tax=Xylaria bambusicola TaxID=326684 RepID=UPI0020082068|nr:uncharacterized protein F5B22DRAFT_594116 [Xylaria bambusicola]KAI0521795.1 hypothetical protein F5B22DRAFT_594116 [Xylaria bambusicola]